LKLKVTQELAELNESDASVASLDQAIDKAETQWRSSARALSKKRSSAAVKLEKAVKKLLNQMNMTDAELTVRSFTFKRREPFWPRGHSLSDLHQSRPIAAGLTENRFRRRALSNLASDTGRHFRQACRSDRRFR
jgi:DNA repair ATPase RecN